MPEAPVLPSLAAQLAVELVVSAAEREWTEAQAQVLELGLNLVPHFVRCQAR